MKTSWTETKQIEAHLDGSAAPGDALLWEARMLLEPELKDKIRWQQKTYEMIHRYGRRQLMQEIEVVHKKLFTSPEHASFGKKIRLLFYKP